MNARRRFFSLSLNTAAAIAVSAVGGTMSRPIGDLASQTLRYVSSKITGQPIPVEISEAMARLFGHFSYHNICVGGGNLVAIEQGKPRAPSGYISRASSLLQHTITSLNSSAQVNETDQLISTDEEVNGPTVHLGGPLANEITLMQLGYRMEPVEGDENLLAMPRPSTGSRLRYFTTYGGVGRGWFNGVYREGVRCENGSKVVRPTFGIVDAHNGKILLNEVKSGEVVSDQLQIVRIRNSISTCFDLFIWGHHGNSLDGFFNPYDGVFHENISKLVGFTEGLNEYQLLIPVAYNNIQTATGWKTNARIDWERFASERSERIVALS